MQKKGGHIIEDIVSSLAYVTDGKCANVKE